MAICTIESFAASQATAEERQAQLIGGAKVDLSKEPDQIYRPYMFGVGNVVYKCRFSSLRGSGAVLLSPCISQGEREIARLAFERGHRVITLGNKGFNPLYKPGGKLFGQCAGGNLLMLAPAAWPYVPGEKPMTRIDACILNRLAQWLAGSGATEIQYRGVAPARIDELATAAVRLFP